MAKEYVEAFETDGLESVVDWVRAEVTDMDATEKAAVQAAVEAVMSGKSYTLSLHTCLHDIGDSCSSEAL